MRTRLIPALIAPLVLATLGLGRSSVDCVPLFAQYASEAPSLHSYSVPLHATVAIHKLFTFHMGMNGMVYYQQPDHIAVDIHSVPEQYRKIFAKLGTPRTWPQSYDLQVIGVDGTGDQKVYHLRGTPYNSCEIDHLTADVSTDNSPVKATWYMRDGGTIAATIEFTNAGSYSVPKDEHIDIDSGGFKIHADLDYGDYAVNGPISDARF
jgi:hypothetical protein